jgi:hypothetical protein
VELAVGVSLLDGGRRIELLADGALRGLEELPTAGRRAIAAALAAGRLALPPRLLELRGQPPSLRGGEGDPAGPVPLGPVATEVASERLTFRWASVPGAEAHQVSVFDQRYRRIAASGWLAGEEWTPAEPLPRGEILSWQVTARLPDREITGPTAAAPEARFRVLAPGELERVEADLASAAGSRLARAVVAAGAGLLDDAAQELAALAAENPHSTVLQSLVLSLEAPRKATGSAL